MQTQRVLIAGASGFVGGELIRILLENPSIEIVALSRREQESDHPRLSWKKCDLFSLKDIRECMKGCDSAYYLVHSMIPSAALTQGKFYDFDLILADNFIRAARETGLKRIIYLSGMIPKDQEFLSWHLKSRLEVEQTLGQSSAQLTTLRAGLVIGKSGSSFMILRRLIERLPLMICPSWTSTRSQPVAIDDIIRVLVRTLHDSKTEGHFYDIGGRDVVSYQDLLMRASRVLGQKRHLFTFDLIPLGLSRLWVSLITGQSKDLVYPLVLSLTHPMVVDPLHSWPYPEDLKTNLDEALSEALLEKPISKPKARSVKKYQFEERVVRSVQRVEHSSGINAEVIAREYFRWLGVSADGEEFTFYFPFTRLKLLVMKRSVENSKPDRQLFYLTGGVLVSKKPSRARLEFRDVLNGSTTIIAIHDYYPALPWYIYVMTQAQLHLAVMYAFKRRCLSLY